MDNGLAEAAELKAIEKVGGCWAGLGSAGVGWPCAYRGLHSWVWQSWGLKSSPCW